jgi:hypothetical protein
MKLSQIMDYVHADPGKTKHVQPGCWKYSKTLSADIYNNMKVAVFKYSVVAID